MRTHSLYTEREGSQAKTDVDTQRETEAKNIDRGRQTGARRMAVIMLTDDTVDGRASCAMEASQSMTEAADAEPSEAYGREKKLC